MKRTIPAWTIVLALGLTFPALAQENAVGRTVESLLDYAKNNLISNKRQRGSFGETLES